jgi:hypothetical protein
MMPRCATPNTVATPRTAHLKGDLGEGDLSPSFNVGAIFLRG